MSRTGSGSFAVALAAVVGVCIVIAGEKDATPAPAARPAPEPTHTEVITRTITHVIHTGPVLTSWPLAVVIIAALAIGYAYLRGRV